MTRTAAAIAMTLTDPAARLAALREIDAFRPLPKRVARREVDFLLGKLARGMAPFPDPAALRTIGDRAFPVR